MITRAVLCAREVAASMQHSKGAASSPLLQHHRRRCRLTSPLSSMLARAVLCVRYVCIALALVHHRRRRSCRRRR
jgi:hypothetical protein